MPSPRTGMVTTCGWCGERIVPKSRGPLPTWCSATCRHRAWEQKRAAASGRSAVEVVDRRVEIRVPSTTTPRRPEPHDPPPATTPRHEPPHPRHAPAATEPPVALPTFPKRHDWPSVLGQLTQQLISGRIYDRDLAALTEALDGVLEALGDRWTIVAPRYRKRPRLPLS